MLFDVHNHAFRALAGVRRRGIYDNMRTAVDKVGRGKERRQVNARFSAMVSHFLFEAEFCSPASGWDKGQIEKNVQDARHRLWQCQRHEHATAARLLLLLPGLPSSRARKPPRDCTSRRSRGRLDQRAIA
jgi:transposase